MKLKVGDSAAIEKRFTADEVARFAALTGDVNPLHFEGQPAEESLFGRPVVHGVFVASLISAALGNQLPGPGTIYLSQSLEFIAPVFFGDTISARVEVTALRQEKGIVTLATTCVNQDGKAVLKGQAVVMNPALKTNESA